MCTVLIHLSTVRSTLTLRSIGATVLNMSTRYYRLIQTTKFLVTKVEQNIQYVMSILLVDFMPTYISDFQNSISPFLTAQLIVIKITER